jgi:sugar phosphate isomerase/epimerase
LSPNPATQSTVHRLGNLDLAWDKTSAAVGFLVVVLAIMKSIPVSRRRFLKTGTVAALAAARPSALLAAGKYGGNHIPFGLQLYSVRNECAKDFDGTLEKVARMGYQAVEFAGYHGRDARSLRKRLDDVGLKCCGTHLALEALLGEELKRTVEFNQILGNPNLVIPSFPSQYTQTRKGWEEVAGIMSGVAAKVKPDHMRVGFHNENIEFTPMDGEVPWDIFFNRANPDVFIQFDTGNGVAEGGDPVIYLKKKPGRVLSVHVKPFSKSKPDALIGDDELDWPEIFRLCETVAGVKWYIIEYEASGMPPLEAVDRTLQVMKFWGKC